MNKRPVLWRTIIALVIIGIFAVSMYPLKERDFFETFLKSVKNPSDPEVVKVLDSAKALRASGKEEFDASALLQAASDNGIYLPYLMKADKLENNGDAISYVRNEAASSIRLGLDLAGGVEIILKLVSPDATPAVNETPEERAAREERYADQERNFERNRDLIIEILRSRLEEQGINESEITPTGDRFITLRAPVVSKEEKQKLAGLVSMSAKLRFHLVHPDNAALVSNYLSLSEDERARFIPPPGYELKEELSFGPKTADGKKEAVRNYYFIQKRWEMDGQGITNAVPQQDPSTRRRSIALSFDAAGTKRFAEVTSKNVGRQLAVVLDDRLYCAPVIRTEILGGNASIDGDFSQEEAMQIADALSSGSIPFVIERDAMFDMDPTLGADNVRNGVWAGVVALIVVALFMGVYYRLAGMVAIVALAVNLVLVLGSLAAFSATLTLPGIAGIILTIGMAVDANVLIFERIRDELRSGKPLAEAMDLGYSKASTAVLDANITTLIIGIILYSVGTGSVKGFAVTLCIGIITSVFCALFLTKVIFDLIGRVYHFKKLTMMAFLTDPHIDFMRYRRIFYTISAVLVIGSIVIMAVRGRDMLSIDFTGGNLLTYNYVERIPTDQLENAVKAMGYDGVKVTYKNNPSDETDRTLEILIRDSDAGEGAISRDEMLNRLNAEFPQAQLSGGSESNVGSLVGATFSKTALWAVILSFLAIVAYTTFRYEFGYGMAAILALIHDVIVATGIFLLCGREISLPVVAAFLTIIGYSINNTIVIFDRIREILALEPNIKYGDVVNMGLNQTLSRTLMTSLTTLIVLVVLFFFGGITINDFVLVMLLGVIIGTYSSACIASPIVASWHKRTQGVMRREKAATKNA